MALIASGYRIVRGAPGVDDYVNLRQRSGLSAKTREQAAIAVLGGWSACHVVHEVTGEAVGMGRVIGDGGWYFHIIDMESFPNTNVEGSVTPSSPSCWIAFVQTLPQGHT